LILTSDFLSGEAMNDCRKTVLVKYLYSIIKYEKGAEISPYTLDDMAEVILGNMSVPNNQDEYKVRETKKYQITSLEKLQGIEYLYSNQFVNSQNITTYGGACSTGNYNTNMNYLYFVCDLSLPLPNEVKDRRKEIELASLSLNLAQGRMNYNTTTHNAGSVYSYPVVSNNPVNWDGSSGSDQTLYKWNTDPSYATLPVPVDYASPNILDISKTVFAGKKTLSWAVIGLLVALLGYTLIGIVQRSI
jgi:hypothetical protein